MIPSYGCIIRFCMQYGCFKTPLLGLAMGVFILEPDYPMGYPVIHVWGLSIDMSIILNVPWCGCYP